MKPLIYIVKIYPFVITMLVMVGFLCDLLVINKKFIENEFIQHTMMMDIIMLMFSIKMKFCFWHRAMIINLITILCVQWMSKNIRLNIDPMTLINIVMIMVCLSISIITFMTYKYGNNKELSKSICSPGR